MSQVVGVLSTDGNVLECGSSALSDARVTRDDIIGRPFWEAFGWSVTPNIQAELREVIGRASQGEFIHRGVEVSARENSQDIMRLDFTLRPIRDRDSRVVSLLFEGQDSANQEGVQKSSHQAVDSRSTNEPSIAIRGTELLRAGPRERYRQQIARITLDSMVQFVGLLDAQGTVLEINHVALNAVGIKLSDVEGKPFWTTFWWQVSEEMNAMLRASIRRAAQGEFVRWDAEIYGRSGGKETIIIDASLMPVKDEHGNVVFITAEGRDITEKKAHEREIARQREELAKLDELKTQFFANVSHEFRTPLTLMMGPLEDILAQPEGLALAHRERLELAHRNSLRLLKLVNTLLDFSRIEAGRIRVLYESTDLPRLTADLASVFRSAIEKAEMELVVDCASPNEPVYVDREMWEKIVLNLISNAFKFTFKGEIAVSLRAVGDAAELTVRDTGTGIPEEEIPRLFDRFHRVKGAQGRSYEGSGIGLALVQELVRLHGGSVRVESELGGGSRFIVSIPRGKSHLPAERVAGEREWGATGLRRDAYVEDVLRWLPDQSQGNRDASALTDRPPEEVDAPTVLPQITKQHATKQHATERARRILLADDNADMRDYVSRMLVHKGYEVKAATDGMAALDAVRVFKPDLVLTDVMMPRLDGFGLLRALRTNAETSALPVILLSARAGEEARVEGLDAGASDYLIKPFSARELLACVGSQLEMAWVRQQAAQREEALRAEAQVERDRALGILESITDGFFTLDRDWRITYVNPAGERLLRAARAELLGQNHRDLFPSALGIVGEHEYRRAVREQIPVNFEILHEPWQHWFAVTAYPARQGGVSVYLRDITEPKLAELELRQQWQTFDTALSNTPDHVYTFDLQGRFSYANQATLVLWQKPLDQLIGKTFTELGAPAAFAERLDRQIREVIETNKSLRDHAEFAGATETRHFEYIFVPVLAADGRVVAVAGSTRDTTDRERIEKALAASEERLQQVFTQAPVAIVAFSGRDFVVELANPTYQALLKDRDFVGRPIAEVVPELGQNVWDELSRVLDSGEPFVANEWHMPYAADLDGSVEDHWFNVVFNPRREADGTVSGVIAVLTDVTAQVVSRQEVDRVNRELEEFAYVASHDLQEPLRMVNSFTQLLLRRHISPDNKDAQEYAEFISQGVRRMELLIRDLLSYSRTLHRDEFISPGEDMTADLNACWLDSVAVMSERIRESGARLTAGPLPVVDGERVQLSHVFQNLLSNAFKYRKPEVPPEISIHAELRDGKWVIAVQDNGIGFEQKYADRIFGLFKRLHKDEYPGTGLGLAICQRIIERYKGRIWAQSEKGVGSTFFIEMPLGKHESNRKSGGACGN